MVLCFGYARKRPTVYVDLRASADSVREQKKTPSQIPPDPQSSPLEEDVQRTEEVSEGRRAHTCANR